MASRLKNIKETDKVWRQTIVPVDSTIGKAIQNLNDFGIKVVLVVDNTNRLVGTISDGDIRRGLLKGLDLNSSIDRVVNENAIVVPLNMPHDMVLQLMVANKIHQVPVVDEQQKLLGLHLWDQVNTPPVLSNLMVIMAGGKGARLMPHTEHCPKPLVELAGKPMLEHIIDSAKLEGFNHFVISIYHLGQMIEDYFGNGERFGVKIDYVREASPLGTAGALGLMINRPDKAFIVTNGDVITDIRYGELLDFHNRHRASATMAVRVHEWQHPFGVVQMKGVEITGFDEKPVARSHINAGVYVLSPEVLTELSANTPCDMPMLFERLQAKAKRTVAYPMHEPWLDVGRPDDLERANGKFKTDLENEPKLD